MKKVYTWGGMVLTVCLAGVLLWGLASMPVKIKRVSIRGQRYLSQAAVERMVNVKPGALVGRAEVRRIERDLIRHPAFQSVTVSRGVTGTLHVRVRERKPVAWIRAYRCAVAEDGTLLPYVRQRDPAWISLDGLKVVRGKVLKAGAVREALEGNALTQELDGFSSGAGGGVWRRLPVPPPTWEWEMGGKRIHMTSPIQREEFKRLHRFQRAYPDAWARARWLDLRFADRVVVKQ